MAHPGGSVGPGMGQRSRATARSRRRAERGHAAGGATASLPGQLRHGDPAHTAAPRTPMARRARPRARSLLRARASAGSTRAVGLHRLRRARGRHRRRRLCAPDRPIRARSLGLAPRGRVRGRRELHCTVHRAAIGTVALGRRARGTPYRQSVGGVQQPGREGRTHTPLRRAVQALRHAREPLQPGSVAGERLDRIAPRFTQDGTRPGTAPAWFALLRRACCLRGAGRDDRGPVQCPRGGAHGGRACHLAPAARTAHG